MAAEMVLRGFAGRLGDLRGRMRFCHPIAIGRRVEFDACAERLARIARLVFDRELRRSASEAGKLSRAGAAALFVLRRTPGRRDTDVAIRELAAANIQDEHDLYRRLLAVLSAKLRASRG